MINADVVTKCHGRPCRKQVIDPEELEQLHLHGRRLENVRQYAQHGSFRRVARSKSRLKCWQEVSLLTSDSPTAAGDRQDVPEASTVQISSKSDDTN